MIESDYKYETFKSWSELLILLEVQAFTNELLLEIVKLHKEKFKGQSNLQDFDKQINVEESDIFIGTNNYLEIIYKWQKTIIFSYKFLQYARSRGGTYGHKVGCLRKFLSDNFEENQQTLKTVQKTE